MILQFILDGYIHIATKKLFCLAEWNKRDSLNSESIQSKSRRQLNSEGLISYSKVNCQKVYCGSSATLSPTAFPGIFDGKSMHIGPSFKQSSKCPLSPAQTCQAFCIFWPPLRSLLPPNLQYWNVLATRLRKIPPFITTCQAQQGHSPSHSPAALLIRPQRRHETSKIFCHRQKLVLICFKIRVSIKLNCAPVERTFWALRGVPMLGAQFWL